MSAGISQANVARRMKVSAAYICDLEQGYRSWNEVLIARFQRACSVKS